MDIVIREAVAEDVTSLSNLAAKLFYQTYYGKMPTQNLETYIEEDFNPEKQHLELEDTSVTTLLAEVNGELIGYAQLRNKPVPVKIDEGVSLELWRIYLDQASQGLGIGQLLISKIKEVALHLSKEKLWLGVWEKNQKAIQFYEKHDFVAVGHQEFRIGNEIHRDIVMIGAINTF